MAGGGDVSASQILRGGRATEGSVPHVVGEAVERPAGFDGEGAPVLDACLVTLVVVGHALNQQVMTLLLGKGPDLHGFRIFGLAVAVGEDANRIAIDVADVALLGLRYGHANRNGSTGDRADDRLLSHSSLLRFASGG